MSQVLQGSARTTRQSVVRYNIVNEPEDPRQALRDQSSIADHQATKRPSHQAQGSLEQWPGRTHEPNDQRSDRQALLLRAHDRPVYL